MLYGIENEIRVGKCKIRRPSKHAENQYTLIRTDDGRFFAFFKDGEDRSRVSEITEALYNEMLQQARDDEAYLRWNRRHLDDSSDVETIADQSAIIRHRIVEDVVIAAVLVGKESNARSVLTALQWRRLYLRFHQGMTLSEIAAFEGCSKMPVKRSIEDALEKIRKILR